MDNPLAAFIKNEIKDSFETKRNIYENEEIIGLIERSSKLVIQAFKNNKKLLIAGNGGSAAEAQHLAAEFVCRFSFTRPGLPCIALTTDTSILTAASNDFGYHNVFARQIGSIGQGGDIFIAISTSGNSRNILEAIRECKDRNIKVIGLTGESGGQMKEMCDLCISVPTDVTPRIQESHILLGHIICSIVEESLFGEGF